MTTVGYGDIAPQTVLGQILAAAVMILGYAIIIVPIGVFSAEMFAATHRESVPKRAPIVPPKATTGMPSTANFADLGFSLLKESPCF